MIIQSADFSIDQNAEIQIKIMKNITAMEPFIDFLSKVKVELTVNTDRYNKSIKWLSLTFLIYDGISLWILSQKYWKTKELLNFQLTN